MTETITRTFQVLEHEWGRPIDQNSMSSARFVTHMRFFFIRMSRGDGQGRGIPAIVDLMSAERPNAWACAIKIANLLELRLGTPVVAEEVAYIALHVARVEAEISGSTSPY